MNERLEMKHLIEVAKRETVIAKGLSSDRESVSLPIDIVLQIIEQAEQAVALRAYADKWSLRLGNVNEFLQHRDVADEWGVDVTIVIMNLVVHLEKQNKRYREILDDLFDIDCPTLLKQKVGTIKDLLESESE